MPANNIIYQLSNITQQSLEELQERLDIIEHKLKFIDKKPTVACLEWLDPLTIAGNLLPEMVTIAGGTPVLVAAGEQSLAIDWQDIQQADPEILVVIVRGLSVERTMREIGLLLQQPGFADLQAIKNKRLYIADGEQFFYYNNAGIVDSIEMLAEIIQPKQFIFGNEGEGWIKFEV
ncbi:ABC transporter substrate-binding protein [Mucilaginibacter terrae]|uniref:ABC-type Fe3+-hydroxamate transport system substrate-binding protein n=1 Tax=Mucilaginibacter terrae TaxID=1955052 RepID=A0ABU3H0H0_9SPHI|nr:ABC transporter substrate-binding protein [Mucilaginibacter terrae]MDT3404405.1 ABC-type Fe3+-hydroxamate transport system substrate-binding protein [Mucilaginibacter terrae]